MGMMMNQKEALRTQVMALLTAGEIDQREAGFRLDVSVRQIKRIVQHYPDFGPTLACEKLHERHGAYSTDRDR
jgi:transposase